MGIDRHEWEHRSYKSGRSNKAAASVELDDPGLNVPDSGLAPDDAPLQPESEKKPAEKSSRKRPARAR